MNKQVMTLLSLLFTVGIHHTAVAQVVLETRDLRLEIGNDGIVQSLTASPSGIEYSWISEPAPIAMVYRGGQLSCASQKDFVENEAPAYHGGQSFPASGVTLAGDKLTIEFATAQVKAMYQVKICPDYLAFELLSLEGKPIDRIDLLNLKVRRLPYLGPWINVAYDDEFGICLCAGNIKTNAGMNQHKQYVEMKAIAEKRVALEGTIAILFGVHNPKNKFLDAMEIVERDFNMPAGARHRRLPVQNYSYLWCYPTPENIEEYVKLAKRCGFRMILFSYRAFSQGVGHFSWNSQYPNGMSDLKKVTDTIRGAGLRVGLHIHYSKAAKNDPYVTPVPDDRLNKVRNFTFSTKIDSKTDTITVNENPSGCTLDDGRRILKAGNELIAYQSYTTSAPFRFSGCERGYLDTTTAEHQPGEEVSLLDVDDWPIFIRFDQNTDIQDETARRLGEIYHRTGPYDMVYIKVWNALLDKVWIDTWKNVEFTDQEHHLFVNECGEHELVAISEIADVADGFFKAYSFRRETRPDDTYILIWAVAGEADLLLPVAPDRLTVMRPFGTRLPVEVKEGRAVVPVGGRKYLILAGMKEARARELLRQAGLSRNR